MGARVNIIWLQWAMRLAAAAGVCALLWATAGSSVALGVLAAMLLFMLLHHVRHQARLFRWLADPRPEALPVSSGLWEDVFAALYHLLRRQRRSESLLTATLHDFRQAGMALPDGLIIVDGGDRIEWCNSKAERHFGLDPQRDAGQLVTYFVRQPQFAAALAVDGYAEPLTLRSTHGGDLILSVLIIPYEADRKLIISRDVTDRERVETMRRDFVANVSHELRTPLTVIGGFLETLADMETPNIGLIRRSVPLMRDQAKRMQGLVEDLLVLSRLESAGNPVSEEPVNVPDIVRALHHDALALSAGRHKLELSLDSTAWVNGAEDELRSAFGNLVSNAIRYTPAGGEVRLSWRGADDGGAVFAVRDTGIGIAPEHVPRLTERFYRVDRGRSRETGGTGLGLAIVKHVVNRHAARLVVSSEPGKGSCFSVVFPAGRITAGEAVGVTPVTARTA
ncbi:MAG: phosphate regulon sensor histidine kinase PhoR [Betaproteobacteria bacterium]|jgi:two-component system phosphate regulon sensor histidine kinase PhoR|nr:phosphate regulon sensor histidine kinase PhoR [Betaproteobacteria bacterium]MDH5343910.1 phosphate regulon sensor histidine kinase PhoR [Betaproteobacteria bacterium]